MDSELKNLFPELGWMSKELAEKVASTFMLGIKYSSLKLEDLKNMPYTASYPTDISFQSHVRLVTHIAVSMYDTCFKQIIQLQRSRSIPNRDFLVAGALLHDVGKLLELTFDENGIITKTQQGRLLRHAFTGVHLAMENNLPDEIIHIIAVHSQEGVASHPTLLAHFVRLADQTAERYSDWDLQQEMS